MENARSPTVAWNPVGVILLLPGYHHFGQSNKFFSSCSTPNSFSNSRFSSRNVFFLWCCSWLSMWFEFYFMMTFVLDAPIMLPHRAGPMSHPSSASGWHYASGWHRVAYVVGTPFESLRVTLRLRVTLSQGDKAGLTGNLFSVYLRSWHTVVTPLGVVFLWKIHGPQR